MIVWPATLFLGFQSGCGGAPSQDSPTAALQEQVSKLTTEVANLAKEVRGEVTEAGRQSSSPNPAIQTHSIAEAKKELAKLGEKPTADQIAHFLAMLDEWAVQPEEENEFRKLQFGRVTELRKKVAAEVVALQKDALKCDSGQKAAEKHADAGHILALYPMADEPMVVAEAKRLSTLQAELAVRLEVLRRQKYNHWAALQIETAVNDFNGNASWITTEAGRQQLIELLVKDLGNVDPVLLEPAVLEMYSYAVELTKGKLYEAEKLKLAKDLTNSSVSRKTLGDF